MLEEKKIYPFNESWLWVKRKERSAKELKMVMLKRMIFTIVLSTTSTFFYLMALHLSGSLNLSFWDLMIVFASMFLAAILAFHGGYTFKKGCNMLNVMDTIMENKNEH